MTLVQSLRYIIVRNGPTNVRAATGIIDISIMFTIT